MTAFYVKKKGKKKFDIVFRFKGIAQFAWQ